MQASALLVEVPESEPFVSEWRLLHDPVARAGIPAHITALYPFRHPDLVDETTVQAIVESIAAVEAFAFSLPHVDEFPGAIYLQPDPAEPFRRLTQVLWQAFPDCPPYGGRFPDPRPHLTLAQPADGQAELRTRIDAAISGLLPITAHADSVSMFVRDSAGSWTRRRVFNLRR